MDKPQFTYNGGKSPHDLSHRLLFTSTVGQLLPILSQNLLPDDHVRIGFNLFTRMADVKTSAFVRIREHIDVYFVPIVQLFSPFEQFIYGVGRPGSSFFYPLDSTGPGPVPSGQPDRFDHIPMFGADTFSSTSTIPDYDAFGVNNVKNLKALSALMGYSNTPQVFTAIGATITVNPFKFLAYQKIFYDWFAIGDRTPIVAQAWNIDSCYTESVISSMHRNYLKVQMHYRPWKLDYFTGVLPSPLESSNSVNAQSNLRGQVKDWLSSKDSVLILDETNTNAALDNGANVGFIPDQYKGTTSGAAGKVTTSAIRSLFAVEKLLEITRRSGKNYADQTAAHFGAKVPQGIDNKSYHIGSISQDLTIQDVDATAAGSATLENDENFSILGQVGGKGKTDQPNNRSLEFHAPCHGILMALYSAEPVLDYPNSMIDRQNLYNVREDYYSPEFDNLGMQPLFGINLNVGDTPYLNKIYGWTYRFQELKESFNRVTLGFAETGLSDWRTVKPLSSMLNAEKDFYVNPDYLNSIMLKSYDKLAPDFGSDPLRHCVDIYLHKSSVMSNFSLPSLKNNM